MSDTHSPADIQKLTRLLKLIESDLGAQLTLTLAVIGCEPGLSINELSDRLGSPQQTASRYVAVLQGRYESPHTSSFARTPLLTLEVSQEDPRRRALFLTPEGKRRLNLIVAANSRVHEKPTSIRKS